MTQGRPTTRVAGVRFEPLGPVRFVAPGAGDLEPGDRVLIECEGGPREAVVAIAPVQVIYSELRGPLAGTVLKRIEATESR